ncbi:MAG: tetratricopeptide repeat protein [bacterium]
MLSQSKYEEAILEFNRVLSDYFEHELAASAQYRVGQCLDALGRHKEATSAYQLVVSGYPLSPQSPAAAYLAGVGLLDENRPQAAVPYFQLVLDRYTGSTKAAGNEGNTGDSTDEDRTAGAADGTIVFSSPERQELVEAALCLLEPDQVVPSMMLKCSMANVASPSAAGGASWAAVVGAAVGAGGTGVGPQPTISVANNTETTTSLTAVIPFSWKSLLFISLSLLSFFVCGSGRTISAVPYQTPTITTATARNF